MTQPISRRQSLRLAGACMATGLFGCDSNSWPTNAKATAVANAVADGTIVVGQSIIGVIKVPLGRIIGLVMTVVGSLAKIVISYLGQDGEQKTAVVELQLTPEQQAIIDKAMAEGSKAEVRFDNGKSDTMQISR